jgi:hypothetical protein
MLANFRMRASGQAGFIRQLLALLRRQCVLQQRIRVLHAGGTEFLAHHRAYAFDVFDLLICHVFISSLGLKNQQRIGSLNPTRWILP